MVTASFIFRQHTGGQCGVTAMTQQDKRYEVVEKSSGDRFGNHTYAEACARARAMCRNWNYKKVFVVEERE